MIIIDVEQGTEKWFDEKMGKPSASRFKDMKAGGNGATRKKYVYQKATEILTGKMPEQYSNAHMERGVEQEPEARALYEMTRDVDVVEVGLALLDDKSACASPDGLVGDKGGTEIKSVIPTVHLETFLSGKMPPAHMAQVQGNLWVFEREWWDFISYSPDMTDKPILVYRIGRDEEYIDMLKSEVERFNKDVKEVVEKFRA